MNRIDSVWYLVKSMWAFESSWTDLKGGLDHHTPRFISSHSQARATVLQWPLASIDGLGRRWSHEDGSDMVNEQYHIQMRHNDTLSSRLCSHGRPTVNGISQCSKKCNITFALLLHYSTYGAGCWCGTHAKKKNLWRKYLSGRRPELRACGHGQMTIVDETQRRVHCCHRRWPRFPPSRPEEP